MRISRPRQPLDAALVAHARDRARERLGLLFGARENRLASRQIRAGESRRLRSVGFDSRDESERGAYSHHAIRLDGRLVPVVYSARHGCVVSVLPESALERSRVGQALESRREPIVVARASAPSLRPRDERRARGMLDAGFSPKQVARALALSVEAVEALAGEEAQS